MNDNQATIETDEAQFGTGRVSVDFARRLERERDEALAKLSAVFQWINRNHPDGFIDSLTHLQNLERVSDVQHDRFDRLERERDLAHDQLSRICKEGFGNQDTIGLEPADDYVLRKLAELKAERDLARERGQDMVDFLSIAEGERDHYRRENGEMREALIACMDIIGPPDGSPELLWKTNDEINAAYTKGQKSLNRSAPATSPEKT